MLLVKLLLENIRVENYGDKYYQDQAGSVHLEKKQYK